MKFMSPAAMSVESLFMAVDEPGAILLQADAAAIDGVTPLSEISHGLLSFYNKTCDELPDSVSGSGATIVLKKSSDINTVKLPDGVNVIAAPNPRLYFFRAVHFLFGDNERPEPGQHEFANVSSKAEIHPTAHIGPFVTIEDGVKVGAHSVVQHGCYVSAGAEIGANVVLRPNVTIGIAGQALERTDSDQQIHLPHLGSVIISDGAIIGAGTVIMRGSLEHTEIGGGAMIGNLVNIGHNCKIGRNVFISAQTVIAGSCRIGDRCWIAPGVSIVNKARLGSNTMVGLGSVVTKSTRADAYVFGNPAKPIPKLNKYNASK